MFGIVMESSAQACVLMIDGGSFNERRDRHLCIASFSLTATTILMGRPICCTMAPPAALPAPPVGKYTSMSRSNSGQT